MIDSGPSADHGRRVPFADLGSGAIRLTAVPLDHHDGDEPGVTAAQAAGPRHRSAHLGLLFAALQRRAVDPYALCDGAPVTAVGLGLNRRAGAVLTIRDGYVRDTLHGRRLAGAATRPHYRLPRPPTGFVIRGWYTRSLPDDPVLRDIAIPLPLTFDQLALLPPAPLGDPLLADPLLPPDPAAPVRLRLAGIWQEPDGGLFPAASWDLFEIDPFGTVTGVLSTPASTVSRSVAADDLLAQPMGVLPDRSPDPVTDLLLVHEQAVLPMVHPSKPPTR